MKNLVDFRVKMLKQIKKFVNTYEYKKIKMLDLKYGIKDITINNKYLFIYFVLDIDYNKNQLVYKIG